MVTDRESLAIAKCAEVGSQVGFQANKGIWWMPWQLGPTKDVVTLRKAPGSCLQADPEISEWGNPLTVMGEDHIICGGKRGN